MKALTYIEHGKIDNTPLITHRDRMDWISKVAIEA